MGVVERVWYGDSVTSTIVRGALWPAEILYGAVVAGRRRLYDTGLWRAHASSLPTVSVGNLTVGGTGKTPVAAWIAARLAVSARPAVILRGYGEDEIHVHQRLNSAVPVIANPDRHEALRVARDRGAQVVVLDDAFQHRRLARDADIVLVSVEQLGRPRRLLPRGPWREPLSAARRSDLLIVTRKSAGVAARDDAIAELRRAAPDVPIAAVHLQPAALRRPDADDARGLEALSGTHVLAIAAIAEPEAFRDQLRQQGADVELAAFRDHHAFSDEEISALAARVAPSGLVVCTLKDAVKLGGRWPGPSRLWYVSQQLVVEMGSDDIDRVLKRVTGRASATITAA